MTREEAIKVLKMVECHGSLTQKAKEMAIEALHTEPIRPKGKLSYISREALLEKEKYLGDWNIDLSYVDIEDVKSIPSADVRENIHGEWIEGEYWEDNDGGFGTWKKCSICGKSKHHKSKFCPNCGADMRGEK